MKKLLLVLLICGLFLNLGLERKSNQLYQVISSHPHDIEKVEAETETVYKNGRLWVVRAEGNASSEVLTYLRPLTGLEKTYVFKSRSQAVMKTALTTHDLKIMRVLNSVSQVNIETDVVHLSSYKNRNAGSTDNHAAGKWIAQRMAGLGLKVTEECYEDGACSYIGEKKGQKNSKEILLVMAHFDSVGQDFAGADDNGSGTAVMLEMARMLKDYDNGRTIRFFATNGEELGLKGAKHYVMRLWEEGELDHVSFAINMDMVGYNSNGVLELETDTVNEPLAQWLASLTIKHTSLTPKITIGAWGSDHVPFLGAGVPTILTLEDWSTKTPCYHLACDKPETLNYKYASEVAKLNVSAVMEKDRH